MVETSTCHDAITERAPRTRARGSCGRSFRWSARRRSQARNLDERGKNCTTSAATRSIDRLCRLTSRKGRQDKRRLDLVRSHNLRFRGGRIETIADVPLVGPRKLCLPSTPRRIALAKPSLEPHATLPLLLRPTSPPHSTDKVARGVLTHPPPLHPSYAFVAPRSFTSTSTCTCREGRSSWTPPRPKLTSSS